MRLRRSVVLGGCRVPEVAAISDLSSHVHVPSPGELYSPVVGSAITTMIAALTEHHLAAGGSSAILAVAGREHVSRGAELLLFEPASRDWLWKREKVADLLRARVGLRRVAAERLHQSAFAALPVDFSGPVFLHNAPYAVDLLRRERPAALPVPYVHNDVFTTWGRHERRRLVNNAYRIVFVSDFLAKRFLPEKECNSTVVTVLNGADTIHFSAPDRTRTEDLTVLFVGKVTAHKGVDLLLEACIGLWQSGLQFRLKVVGSQGLSGDWPVSDFERAMRARAAPWQGKIEWTGFVDRESLPAHFANADVYCVPSNWDEPCALTLPEGMAAGLPIVAARRGGLPEVGEEAVLWFDPPSVLELSAQLRELLTNAALRASLSSRARQRADELSWANQAARLSKLLEPGGT